MAPCKMHFSSALTFSHTVNEALDSACPLHLLHEGHAIHWLRGYKSGHGAWRICVCMCVCAFAQQCGGQAEANGGFTTALLTKTAWPFLHSAVVLSSLSVAIIQLNSSQASAALAVRGRFLDASREGEQQRKLIERAMWVSTTVEPLEWNRVRMKQAHIWQLCGLYLNHFSAQIV